ncbi:non-specific lipid-transfer protein 1-like isoform X1 [Alnus glutinosa]|uniref:non-specific lipid-transfer protein 1-like isoform X1 n=1 Tax=Alnus glutinosa TaxID=3517 RepID=UPI002D774AFE|nr:non-specific lipid-transfer protein 1-like isoform X1 [Alnus glutinosa]
MASSSIALRFSCVVLMCMMVYAPVADAAVSCGQVQSNLLPCFPYLRNSGNGAVPPACCGGIVAVNNAAKTTPDRQTVCDCLKKAASAFSTVNPNVIAGLPAKCKVNVPYKISASTNCKTTMMEKQYFNRGIVDTHVDVVAS